MPTDLLHEIKLAEHNDCCLQAFVFGLMVAVIAIALHMKGAKQSSCEGRRLALHVPSSS